MKKSKKVQADLPITPTPQTVTGFDGKPLRATTPEAVQEAADMYFDRKDALESAKDRLETAVLSLEAELAAHKLDMAVVRDSTGLPYTVRLRKGKTRLEVKAVKVS